MRIFTVSVSELCSNYDYTELINTFVMIAVLNLPLHFSEKSGFVVIQRPRLEMSLLSSVVPRPPQIYPVDLVQTYSGQPLRPDQGEPLLVL